MFLSTTFTKKYTFGGDILLYRIKARLCLLGRKQTDLIPALRKQGYKIGASDLSRAINGVDATPKADMIVAACNDIISSWESSSNKQPGGA